MTDSAEVILLGSGSADGWPNPWCDCQACRAARAAGLVRARTSALVDRGILIDPGPDLPTRSPASLAGVHTVLVTHSHPDHLDPAFLLAWDWAAARTGRRQPLLVAGPEVALAGLRDWVAPTAPVTFAPLDAGAELVRSGWRIRALPAAHSLSGAAQPDGTALLYELTSAVGRILWATDTARLPHEELADRYDLVFLEETFGDWADHGTAHLGLAGFAAELATLRAAGRLPATAQVVAVHLSHHNPPDLAQRLAELGALAGTDLTRFRLPSGRGSRTLLTGGARSGKSSRAEQLAGRSGRRVVYVATAPRYPDDPQWVARIQAHRVRRPGHWLVRETFDLVGELSVAQATDLLLVDCLALWLTRLIDDAGAWDSPERAAEALGAALPGLLAALAQAPCEVVLVTNEVGSGVVPATASGRLFQDLLGYLNAQVAQGCDRVELLVAGQPVVLRGGELAG